MKRYLPLLVVFLFACSTLGTPTALTDVPVPVTETVPPAITDTPVSPTSPPTSPTAINATFFPDPNIYNWAAVVSGFTSPVDIQFADDDTGRMFVIEQAGRIDIVKNGQILQPAFLNIKDRVGSGGNEQGLLGLAFHPDFKANPYFYVNYTDKQGDTVIARFQASGDSADPGSEKDLLKIDQPFQNHNGGVLAFGPQDGFLYAGLGDGGSADDPFGNGQNTNVFLGKVLRIDVDHGDPYTIPADNPFARGGGKPEIWAYGLRNPWRLSFDKLTGDLYIADVGQDAWEEVNAAIGNPPGLDYGWNYREATHPFRGSPPATLKLTYPVAEYSHSDGGCSVSGGYVYRGSMPEWQGIYLYGDFCSGKIWGILHPPDPASGKLWKSEVLFETKGAITTFGQDRAGEIYFADRSGTIYRLQK